MELTLQQLFGTNVFQNSQSLIIYKNDLFGLVPDINNRAEQLLVAILIKVIENFEGIITDEFNYSLTDENSYLISFDNKDLFDTLNVFLWKPQIIADYILNQIIVEINAPN